MVRKKQFQLITLSYIALKSYYTFQYCQQIQDDTSFLPNEEEMQNAEYSSSSSSTSRSTRDDNNPRPTQNQRLMQNMTPFDNQLTNHVIFTSP